MPPAVQTLPRQELCPDSTNTREACALPYDLAVQGRATGARVELTFTNAGAAGAAFIVYSNVRTDGPWYYTVEAGKSRKIAGHVESGKASRTDPMINVVRAAPVALEGGPRYVTKGAQVTFNYAAPAGKLDAKNWVGIWKAGVTPSSGTWSSWQYVAKAGGKATFDTSKLAAGNYVAWMFHNDTYAVLAGPVNFTVR